MPKLRDIAYTIKANYWFIPTLMTFGAILLAVLMVQLPITPFATAPFLRTVYSYDANAARSILSVIAGSMITVVSIVFSITIVALSLTSQQYGPRMIETFIRDRDTQFVIGTFIAVFTYCTTVMGSVSEIGVVPYFAVLLGLLFTLVALCVLIFYIHNVAYSIRGEFIVAKVAHDMHLMLDDIDAEDKPAPNDFTPPTFTREDETLIASLETGYLQKVYLNDLLELAVRYDLLIRVERGPGDFVLEGSPIATVLDASAITEALCIEINDLFDMGRARTVEQDVKLLFDKLVETAVRSMSPAINDPVTTMLCLDRLAEGLRLLAQHPVRSPYRFDEKSRLRLIVLRPVTFAWMVDIAFTQIRRYAKSDLAVLTHMLRLIGMLAVQVSGEDAEKALRKQAHLIMEQSRVSGLFLPTELETIQRRYEETMRYCSMPLAGVPTVRMSGTSTSERELIATE